ncbi:Ldh family oxidoreductase [Polynucleobacter paneuropaeus]|nr:Ldh family oxidoreductase [Polynucleobacter paneuropaeus]
MKYFDSVRLSKIMDHDLEERGVIAESRKNVIECLIQTSLRGVDSHGINLFPHYCRAAQAGRINVSPGISIYKSGASTAIVDADHAFGHHAGAVAMHEAINLASQTGVGAVGVKNSTHFSAAAYYGLMAAERRFLGFAFTNADALVKASGAKEAFFGTNPICFTAPMKNEDPLCLDMATSLVSWNKVMNYRRENQVLPDMWAFNKEGIVTTNPHEAASLSPAAEYKGFGLGLMIDILCATLLGGVQGKDLRPMYQLPIDSFKRGIGHFFMAIDVSKFCDPEIFTQRLQDMVDRIRALESTPGVIPMVPGDPEKKSLKLRTTLGIPVDELKYLEFCEINPAYGDAIL